MATNEELYNAYIEVMRKTDLRINYRINKATREFVNQLSTTSKPFNVLFNQYTKEIGLREDLAVVTRSSLIQQTAIGYGVIPTASVSVIDAQATVDNMVNIFGKTNGMKLSDQIYKTIDSTTELVRSTLQENHKNMTVFNKTVSNMEKALEKNVLSESKISGYMKRIERTGKRAINIGDDLAKKEFDDAVRIARSNIEQLTENRTLQRSQRAALKQAINSVKKNNIDNLQKSITRSINAKYKSNMQRLVVTENSRVFEQSRHNERLDNPLVTAIKFNLSSSHRIFDECDILASRDGFGLGRGIFPLDQAPRLPIHPNGVSFLTNVTKRRVSEQRAKEAGKYKGNEYAKEAEKDGLSPSQVENLKTMEQMRRVRIDSDKAIDITTE